MANDLDSFQYACYEVPIEIEIEVATGKTKVICIDPTFLMNQATEENE